MMALAVLSSGEAIRAFTSTDSAREREFLIDNLLVLIHLIIDISLVDRPCAMGV